jgi:hypothetical protein
MQGDRRKGGCLLWERGAAQQGRRPSKKMEKINAEEEQQRRWAEKRRVIYKWIIRQ